MPSLRKRVSSFIRQLSVNNQLGETNNGSRTQSGCFIQRYLSGNDVRRMAPTILHGRNPHELPPKALGEPMSGPGSVFAAVTGPEGGLTTVNRHERHITTNDPDVDYIDIHDQTEKEQVSVASMECVFSPGYGRWFKIRPPETNYTHNNAVMRIRAAGSVYTIGTKSVHTSMSDLHWPDDNESSSQDVNIGRSSVSQDDLLNENDTDESSRPLYHTVAKDNLSANDDVNRNQTKEQPVSITDNDVIPPPLEYASVTDDEPQSHGENASEDFVPLPLRKSKSAPNPFKKIRPKVVLGEKVAEERAKANVGVSNERKIEVAGVSDWSLPHERAYGAATTLYELHPVTCENAGSPIADCFAVVARTDSAILALADGVNWGQKACVAARSAVHGSVEYLNKALFSSALSTYPTSTTEVFVALLRAFHAAHSLILQEQGMLTTLTAALVLPLAAPGRYVVCVCNVGDSLAYVYSPRHGVREITQGSHDIHCMRDMRDALGALGPVDGCNPELNNLTCSMTEVEDGDIVFLTSDGISDNFDPVVGKFAVLPKEEPSGDSHRHRSGHGDHHSHRHQRNSGASHSKSHSRSASSGEALPTVQAFQRHELTLLRMEDLLKLGVSGQGPPVRNARELCDLLLDFATRITAAKRHILEDTDLYCVVGEDSKVTELSKAEQRLRRKKVCDKLAMVPGKLDHATVVAYQVGEYASRDEESDSCHVDPDRLLETGL